MTCIVIDEIKFIIQNVIIEFKRECYFRTRGINSIFGKLTPRSLLQGCLLTLGKPCPYCSTIIITPMSSGPMFQWCPFQNNDDHDVDNIENKMLIKKKEEKQSLETWFVLLLVSVYILGNKKWLLAPPHLCQRN